jgi:hypothetical protein
LCYKIPITHLSEPHAVKVFEIKQYEQWGFLLNSLVKSTHERIYFNKIALM